MTRLTGAGSTGSSNRSAEVEERITEVIAIDAEAKAPSSGKRLSGIYERPEADAKLKIQRLEVFTARRFPKIYLGMR